LDVNLADLYSFDDDLGNTAQHRPNEIIEFLERSAKKLAIDLLRIDSAHDEGFRTNIQVNIFSHAQPLSIRDLDVNSNISYLF
jgi:DNA replicative helicase MCM subunit Mcm2 (Cdc46/Mcm family)